MQTVDDTNQHELDELQAKWVLGKQRGEEMPLGKEELERLLEVGVLHFELLNPQEKMLLKGVVVNQNNFDLFDTARLIVSSLLRLEFNSNHVDSLIQHNQPIESLSLQNEMFKLKYGSYPDYFVYKVVEILKSNYAQQ